MVTPLTRLHCTAQVEEVNAYLTRRLYWNFSKKEGFIRGWEDKQSMKLVLLAARRVIQLGTKSFCHRSRLFSSSSPLYDVKKKILNTPLKEHIAPLKEKLDSYREEIYTIPNIIT